MLRDLQWESTEGRRPRWNLVSRPRCIWFKVHSAGIHTRQNRVVLAVTIHSRTPWAIEGVGQRVGGFNGVASPQRIDVNGGNGVEASTYPARRER